MSNEFNKDDKHWLLNILSNRTLNKEDEALLFSVFDSETNEDINVIQKNLKEHYFLKKFAVAKLLLFIPEFILLKTLFNPKNISYKKELGKLFYKFLMNKINVIQFKKELKEFLKNDIIL